MARNIAQKANLARPLIIQNRTAQRSKDFAASLSNPSLVAVVETIAEAVTPADIIFTSLGDDVSVRDMYTEILSVPGGVAGKLFVESSTILPETTNELSERAFNAGAEFVAMPGTCTFPGFARAPANFADSLWRARHGRRRVARRDCCGRGTLD